MKMRGSKWVNETVNQMLQQKKIPASHQGIPDRRAGNTKQYSNTFNPLYGDSNSNPRLGT